MRFLTSDASSDYFVDLAPYNGQLPGKTCKMYLTPEEDEGKERDREPKEYILQGEQEVL